LATSSHNSVATGQFAKSSNEPLAVDVNDSVVNDDTGTISSTYKPSTRANVVDSGTNYLIGAFERGTQTLANAIKEVAIASNGFVR
jgi:hypothetical protein